MADNENNNAAKPAGPVRARRWTGTGAPSAKPAGPYRRVIRLIGIPVIAVAAVILYRGLGDRFVLPKCDSDSAKQTLSQVLKELKLEPTKYAPITTVSSSKDKVVCNAVMPLPDGGSVVVDYSFYWQASTANMHYSVHRQAAKSSSLGAPREASYAVAGLR
jgi:hypothetical protein